ncbi:hypothetical protein RvY_06119 [Ramazzottius varieornatus]|uniref:Origin recognition complex subunit 2 n=1 Tax=Ramazzottius varieornatus TaxID=947166 RepID=A0A1D1V3V0_RAMVA|nr:hypothetical protein RvY_06119 [Ramazzottius varieornatus]
MPRFTAKESLAQLQDHSETDEASSDIGLDSVPARQPVKNIDKLPAARPKNAKQKAASMDNEASDGKAPARRGRHAHDRLMEESDEEDSQNEGDGERDTNTRGDVEEPTASCTSQFIDEDRNKGRRRSNVSPTQLGKGMDKEQGSEDDGEEWPSFSVRKSLKFDEPPAKNRQELTRKEKAPNEAAIAADETMAEDANEQLDEEAPERIPEGPDNDRDVYMSQAQVEAVLEGLEDPWKEKKEMLMDRYAKQFSEWHSFLQQLNSNVILHGVGSKRALLQRFRDEWLQEELVWELHGYRPAFDLEDNLRTFCAKVVRTDPVPSKVEEMLVAVRRFAKENDGLYILVHNIDGANLRNVKSQELFSRLAALRFVHLIVSMDNPNLPLLWSQEVISRFKWVYYDTPTLAHYEEFAIPDLTFKKTKTNPLSLASLRTVFQSLTSNARKIYEEVALYQSTPEEEHHEGPPRKKGIPYKQLYRKCVSRLLISSDGMLRKQLVEFYDHDLLRSEKDLEGNEYMRIPATQDVLKKFLDSK